VVLVLDGAAVLDARDRRAGAEVGVRVRQRAGGRERDLERAEEEADLGDVPEAAGLRALDDAEASAASVVVVSLCFSYPIREFKFFGTKRCNKAVICTIHKGMFVDGIETGNLVC
jgi:hypothetical protein